MSEAADVEIAPKDISGFLVVNKPTGVTSHDVVAFVRRRFNTQKVGHAGTLDPLATGVLVLGIGAGTRVLEYLVGCDKEYLAEVTLGAMSTTYDAEGELTPVLGAHEKDRTEVETTLATFVGEIMQVPPIYSAIKIAGKSAHARVRAGEEVELPARQVTIYSIRVTKYAWPKIEMMVHVSSGTYIRSLAHDVGQLLGVGGYLSRLTRMRSGRFELADAVPTLHHIRIEKLLPIAVAVADLPRLNLTAIEVGRIRHGQAINARECQPGQMIAGFFDGQLVATLRCESNGCLKPEKVLVQ